MLTLNDIAALFLGSAMGLVLGLIVWLVVA